MSVTTIDIDPGNTISIFGEISEVVKTDLRKAFTGIGGFSGFKIKRKDKIFSAALYKKQKTFDYRLRPAVTMLRLLGRELDGKQLIDGLPDVVLSKPLSEIAISSSGDTITIDSKSMAETLSVMKSCDDEASIGETNPLEIWGDKKFEITIKEIIKLEQSGRIVCDTNIFPTDFYIALAKQTTKHISYYSDRRIQPIKSCGTPERAAEILKLLDECAKRTEEALQRIGPRKDENDDDYEELCYQFDKNSGRLKRVIQSLNEDPKKIASIDSEHQQFISSVLENPLEYGFKDSAHCETALQCSLNEFSSSVCQTQKGYFMVDGHSDSYNQLCEKTPVPVTFLSAAGIDFCTEMSTIVEGDKYFTKSETWTTEDPLHKRYSGWKEGGAADFYERVLILYKCIFKSAQLQGVTHPCVLPMGLGVFLENVPECCRSEVKAAYFKAQLSLLTESWGFTCYCINSGPPSLVQFFKDLISEFDCSKLKCPIILHSRDVKFLAVSLASFSMSSGYLNPSDAIAVLQGVIGYYWEVGKGSCYVGEEDFAATSTATLSRVNVLF